MITDERWRSLAGFTRWSGALVLVLFLVLGFFAIEDGAPLHRWTGLIQRVLVAVWFVWMIVVALRIRADLGRHS
jgi:cytochrome b